MVKQNPFSIYDFLGYLVPGSTFLYAIVIIDYIKECKTFDLPEITTYLGGFGLDNIFLFVIISYAVGHLISFSSSLSVELYANWRYFYPSKYLLNIEHKGYWRSAKHWKDILWRIFIAIGLMPIFLLDFILGHLLSFKNHFRKPLDRELNKLVRHKIKILLKRLGVEGVGKHNEKDEYYTDFHRLVTHYAYETSKQHQSRMSNYVALYGFLRTLCLIFNLLTWYVFLRVILWFDFNGESIVLIVSLSITSYIFFMAFMKFYRRYTLEGFMIICVNEELK
ncbi:MAG: hypothetical protein ABJH05_12310 [Fulvivirga sp.]